MQERFTFGKHERLTHRKVIDTLFQKGTSYKQFPLLFIVLPHPHPGDEPVESVIIASKRNFRKAVDRNRVKRVLREGWRLNKNAVREAAKTENIRLAIAIVYIGKKLPQFEDINAKICELKERLIEDIPNFPKNGQETNQNEAQHPKI